MVLSENKTDTFMKTICLYFQVHQPFRFKRYRFFDIGEEHQYCDDYTNKAIMKKIAKKCYLPANEILLKLAKKHNNNFKVSFSISGTAIEQFELYAPEVLESFKDLAATGCVEFLSETYSHSLASVISNDEFIAQVNAHSEKIYNTFNQKPTVFRNTELIYNDDIGETIATMGFKAMITEGAKHILGWKSPNKLYHNAKNEKLKLLLKNFKFSDDIAFRFSNKEWKEYPLSAKKFVNWLSEVDEKDELINLFMDYETFGEHQWEDTGILDFLNEFPEVALETNKFKFATPSEIVAKCGATEALNVPYSISWADEERDLTAWLGNELQDEAFNKLYELADQIKQIDDEQIKIDWLKLQTSDHFYYMCTKVLSDGDVHKYFTPYNSPYEAFINYMNILSDFNIRVSKATKAISNERVNKTDYSFVSNAVQESEDASPSIRLDSRMTVKSLKGLLNEVLNVSAKVYKNEKSKKKNVSIADDVKLNKVTAQKKHVLSQAVIYINDTMTVKEFENIFNDKFKIQIRLTDIKDDKKIKKKSLLSSFNLSIE